MHNKIKHTSYFSLISHFYCKLNAGHLFFKLKLSKFLCLKLLCSYTYGGILQKAKICSLLALWTSRKLFSNTWCHTEHNLIESCIKQIGLSLSYGGVMLPVLKVQWTNSISCEQSVFSPLWLVNALNSPLNLPYLNSSGKPQFKQSTSCSTLRFPREQDRIREAANLPQVRGSQMYMRQINSYYIL